jgi:hypothetical protein
MVRAPEARLAVEEVEECRRILKLNHPCSISLWFRVEKDPVFAWKWIENGVRY